MFTRLAIIMMMILMFRCSSAILSPASRSKVAMPFRSWTCHGSSQNNLCDHLMAAGIIQSDIVKSIMTDTDRSHYMRTGWNERIDVPNAYVDAPFPIGLGQTISAPHMHAIVLEAMRPQLEGISMNVLDVGCGSGYLTACLGRWGRTKQPNGTVFGIDIHTSLVERTRSNIQADDETLFDTIQLQVANGWNGIPSEAPFDAIHVGAAAEELPIQLAMQLKHSGALIVPIGPEHGRQALYKIVRENVSEEFDLEDFAITKLLDVRYVPLVRGTTGGMNMAP